MNENMFENKDIIESINNSIDNNENPNAIKKMLKKDHGQNISYTTLCSKIEEKFKRIWNKKAKKYEPCPQLSIDDLKHADEPQDSTSDSKPSEQAHQSDDGKGDSEATESPQRVEDKEEEKVDDVARIINYLDTLNKNINHLDTRLKRIESSISKVTQNSSMAQGAKENSPQRSEKIIDEFIKIYASDKDRKSVRINSQIRKRIIKHIENIYGIESDDKLAIDLALLLALYQSNPPKPSDDKQVGQKKTDD